MVIVLTVFSILMLYDLPALIKHKEPARVIAVYIFLMAVSLIVSLLLAVDKAPSSPAKWIEWMLKMIGVVK